MPAPAGAVEGAGAGDAGVAGMAVEGGVAGAVVLAGVAGAEQATASSATATIVTRTAGRPSMTSPSLTTCAVGRRHIMHPAGRGRAPYSARLGQIAR